MNYFFPNIIQKDESLDLNTDFPEKTINSGKNAITWILRNTKKIKSRKVYMPAFVCSSALNGVINAGFEPIFIDNKKDSIHCSYDDIFKNPIADVVLLVHLFGELHPDTSKITKYCNSNGLFLIHDAAQSYGIEESLMGINYPIIYSFGYGKSSSAAGGAIIRYSNLPNLRKPNYSKLIDIINRYSFYSRLYENIYKLNKLDYVLLKFCRFMGLINSNKISSMTSFQKVIAANVISKIKYQSNDRVIRYNILVDCISLNPYLKTVLSGNGLKFKFLCFCKYINEFKNYLIINKVPFYQLYPDINETKNKELKLPNFFEFSPCVFEFSTESSIPIKEIHRVGDLIKKFNIEI
tara:strand:- start:2160 stop:3212 length:1053 start_codon:yes stop_codon:yes gene_type:complete